MDSQTKSVFNNVSVFSLKLSSIYSVGNMIIIGNTDNDRTGILEIRVQTAT